MNEQSQSADVQKLLKEATQTHLWGSIQLDFQDGQLVLIRRTETIRVSRENNRHERTGDR